MDILSKKRINKPSILIPIANIYKQIDTKIIKAKKDKLKAKKEKKGKRIKEHIDYEKKKQKIKNGVYNEFRLKEPIIKFHLRGNEIVSVKKKEYVYINKRLLRFIYPCIFTAIFIYSAKIGPKRYLSNNHFRINFYRL